MSKKRNWEVPRPRKGVWYAHRRDFLFTVQHPVIKPWSQLGRYYVVANEEEAERPTSPEAIATPWFYRQNVFIGEF